MRVGDRYASHDDASQQLHNTLVELDGELCHLEKYDGWSFTIRRVVVDGKKRRWAKKLETRNIRDADLNLQQFPLGYVNFHNAAYYLKRKPLRKWKQGFYHEYMNLIVNETSVNPGKKPALPRGHALVQARGVPTVGNVFHDQAMVDLYDQNYPSFTRAWVMVSLMQYKSVAWHRHWAFSTEDIVHNRARRKAFFLLYKGKIVGRVEGGDVILKHEFRYLTEPFVEAMIHAS